MYPFILATHNIVRWLIIIAALAAIIRALWGWFGRKEWSKTDNLVGAIYAGLMDLNVLLGLLLYIFLSPITQAALADFGAAMRDTTLRFFAIEHLTTMIIALVLVHVGRSLSRKATEAVKKHRRAALWFILSLVAILAAIPWDRPFFRLGG